MNKKQTITAHRGASGLVAFENTIEAFQKAIELKCDAIELDVRMTSDQKIIVHHDDHIDQVLLRKMKYKEVLALAKTKGYVVPTLEEVLRLCRRKIFLDIELKEKGYEEEVVFLVLKYLSDEEFFMRSFNRHSLRHIKNINTNIQTGLLLGVGKPKYGFFTRIAELYPLIPIMRSHCDFISPHYRLLRFNFVKRMQRLRIPIIVWTVNDETLMKKILFEDNVDGIVTDYPDVGLRLIKEHTIALKAKAEELAHIEAEKIALKEAKKNKKKYKDQEVNENVEL